jgi:hypothetical protein
MVQGIRGAAIVDADDAIAILRAFLGLPEWAATMSASEIDGAEVIVISVERRYANHLHFVPKTFEGFPVIVQIDPLKVGH